MNPPRHRILLELILFLFVGARALAGPAGEKTTRHDLVVQKVYSVQDGSHLFRAYGVEWKGQEAVVEDRLAVTNYHTDDTITVLVMKLPHPSPVASHGLLSFGIVPPRGAVAAPTAPAAGAGPAPKLSPLRQNLKVQKVISVEDEGYIYRGYVVSWNGEEVVANDPLVATRNQTGDALTVLVMKLSHPDRTRSDGLLHFGAFGNPRADFLGVLGR